MVSFIVGRDAGIMLLSFQSPSRLLFGRQLTDISGSGASAVDRGLRDIRKEEGADILRMRVNFT